MSESKEPLLPDTEEEEESLTDSNEDRPLRTAEVPRESRVMYKRNRSAIFLVVLLAIACFVFVKLGGWSQAGETTGAGGSAICANGAPTASTRNGTYCGFFHAPHNQEIFLGMPYAQPPVGDLRFRAPQPLTVSFTGVRRATHYSLNCLGRAPDNVADKADEDCLYLNVVRPVLKDRREKLPVTVWIHGGGFVAGATSLDRNNMSYIVHEGVVAKKQFIGVSINYRLAVWGFLAGTEVWNSKQTNIGLRDQRLALQWVHENIEAFGGDPTKVTIVGKSAGAASVGLHLTAYGGRDDKLFRAAVMQSGSPVFYGAMKHTKDFDEGYQKLVEEVDCESASDRLQCLRNVPSKSISAAYRRNSHLMGVPTLDEDFVQKLPYEHLAAQEFVHVPIISGANTDEGTSFGQRGINTPAEFRAMVERLVKPSLVSEILDAYVDDECFGIPEEIGCRRLGAPYGAQFRRVAAFMGDLTFIAPRRLTCTTWAQAGLSAYCYRFNARPARTPPEEGAGHLADVWYAISHPLGARGTGDPPAPEHVRLGKLVGRSWASFFVDGDPNSFRGSAATDDVAAGLPRWPAYDATARMQFVFDALPEGSNGASDNTGGNHVEADTFREEGISIINSCADFRAQRP